MLLKKIGVATLFALCLIGVVGCSGNDTNDNAKNDEKIIIQLNSSQSEGSIAVDGAYMLKDYVENKIGKDRIEIQVFPGAQLGSDTDILMGMQLGIHDALIVGAPMTTVDKKFYLFDLPYLFNTREDVEKITKGPVGEKLNESLKEKGFINLGYWFTGWRQITNNAHPIYTPEDLHGLKIRISTSPSRQHVLEAMGAAPVALAASETFSAMQQGVVDGQENPIYVLETSAYADVQKYASLTNYLVLVYEVVFAEEEWNSYPADVQQALREGAQIVQEASWEMTEELETEVYEYLDGKVEINDVDVESFKKSTESLYTDPYFVNAIGEDLLNEVLMILDRK